jgi:hypothetical protein
MDDDRRFEQARGRATGLGHEMEVRDTDSPHWLRFERCRRCNRYLGLAQQLGGTIVSGSAVLTPCDGDAGIG